MILEHVPTNSDKQTIIRIEGLARPISILHLTDCHMNETDLREGEALFEESTRMYNFDAMATRYNFETALRYARDKRFDCVALTGDVVNSATINNLDYLYGQLEALPQPYLYTLGNHDWEFPRMAWSESTRSNQYSKFNRLTRGNPAYQSVLLHGVNLIAIDNSTYQVSPEQLAFVKEQLTRGLPTLLFMHIPIYIPSLLEDVIKTWKSPIMMAAEGWDLSLRKQWQVEEASDSTRAFYRLLWDNPCGNLAGAFCGHVHFAHADAFGQGSYQYVTAPGFAGGYRSIHLLPQA